LAAKRFAVAVSALLTLLALGCVSAPPLGHDAISAVEIRGGEIAEDPALEEGLATQEDTVFDQDVLEKDLERVRRFYRARGYYEADVRAARVVRVGAQKVRVEIDVTPGSPVLVSNVDLVGFEALPRDLGRDARDAIQLRVGEPLVEKLLHSDARGVESALANESYAFAKVVERAEVSVSQRQARIEYRLTAGPKAVFGDVVLEGTGPLDREVILGVLGIQKGDPYSKRELDSAKRRLFALGVFSSVDIVSDLRNPDNPAVPMRVTVAVGPTHALHFGAVVEQDSVLALAGLRLGWESRNFLGGMRRFTADATPGVIFYPLSETDVDLKVLPTVTSSFRLEQPAFIDAKTTGFVQSNLNVYPVLYSDFNVGDNIIGFQEVKGGVGAERPVAGDVLKVRPSYNAQLSVPFMYLGEKPEGLDTVVILFPELVGEADLRDDPIEPRSGAFFRLTAQVAGFFAGDADDLRLEPEVRLYGKLGPSFTLAYRAELGLLFPNLCHDERTRGCYGDSLTRSSTVPADDPRVVRDQQLLLFRGFYSGGATSNRGYNQREVGPHGTLGFLVPSNVNCAVPNPPESCIRPLGGLTLWEQSLELRLILSEYAGVVFFLDASDVTRQMVTFRLDFPHLSAGSGFRLRTPVGAARIDVGLRVPYAQEIGEKTLPPEEGDPTTILGAPIAFHFGLGEAF
jgi:outer membrane protein insertion porin family/translocation and assembly module TamA